MAGSKDDFPKMDEARWLTELCRDVDSNNPTVRTRALEMLGRYMGLLQAKGAKAGPRKTITFDD